MKGMRHAVMMSFWQRQNALVALVALSVFACGTQTVDNGNPDVAAADESIGTDAEQEVQGTDTDGSGQTDAALDAATDAVSDAATDDAVEEVAPDVDDVQELTDAAPGTDAIDVPDTKPDVPPEDASGIGKSVHATACSTNSDCDIPCAKGSCVNGTCSFIAKGNVCLTPYGDGQVACYGAGLADDVTPCLACAPKIASNKLSAISGIAALDGPGEGVSVEDTVKGGIGWNFSSARSISGGASLYFGDPTTLTYANNKHVAGNATLPPLPVPKTAGVNPAVSFWLWMDTESSAGYDMLTVSAIDGNATVPLWNSDVLLSTTHGSWQRITLDASSWAGQKITLQFAFDSIDGSVNAFEGVYIDEIEVSTGCCAAPSDCDDGNACSADLCEPTSGGTPACVHTPKADCCNTVGDCNDGLACTLDLCPVAGGPCQHSAKVDCCNTAADCDDQDACTVDACSGLGGSCKHQNTCCKTDAECKSADSCFTGNCSAGQCVFQSVCCQKDDDCDDFNPCTKDACDAGKCAYAASTAPGCCAPVVLSSGFDGNDGGYTITPMASGGPTWHAKDVADSLGGMGVLAFGDPNSATYTMSAATKPKAIALAPFVTLLGGKEASLSFSYRADTVSSAMALRVSVDVDGADTTIATKTINTSSISWQTVTIDLSSIAGKSFALRFEVSPQSTFGSLTNTQLYLDNVHIDSTCQVKKCASTAACAPAFALSCYTGVCSDGQCTWPYSCCATDGDCQDNVLCTKDKCVNQHCQFTPIQNCCMGNGDCNDSDPCTTDSCPGPGADCSFAPIPGCCKTNIGCDDKNACTIDTCLKNVCSNQNTCCSADVDCADGETKCTVDTCVSQKCVHKSTGAAGCCTPDIWSNEFDVNDAKGMTFSNSASANQGWQLWLGSTQTKSAPGVLYYGDPNLGNYDFGTNNGTAKTPLIALPADVTAKVSFDLYMETESSSFYDELTVNIYVGGAMTTLWDKGAIGFITGKWANVSLDLSKYIGQEVQLEFAFNTMDGVANSGFGVAVDNLHFIAACP
jgi:hypothetical protein